MWTSTDDPAPKDFKKHRIWETIFNKVHFIQDGPHGYWTVHLNKGGSPPALKGSFLSITAAEAAVIQHYIIPKKEKIRKKIN